LESPFFTILIRSITALYFFNAFAADTAASGNLCKANTTFTLDLFKSLGGKDKTSNVFFSPLSISSALSMLLLGAKGSTAKQMREVEVYYVCTMYSLCLPYLVLPQCLKTKDCKDVHSSFAALLQELNKPDSSYLSRVENIFTYHTAKFLEETRKFYNAELESVDFLNKAEEARNQINSWVEEQTQGKIKDLLVRDAVDSSSKLVLVNAIYLKADWKEQFEKDFTRDAVFRLNKRETRTVKMMWHKSKFKLRHVKEVIELPYKRGELSMLIFLPNDIEDNTTGLEKLEKQLTCETFMEWTRPDKMDLHQVELKLPRFRVEENYELSEVLKHMGMEDAFAQTRCDFSGEENLMLSKAVHKAFVDVNEAGTEAGAATFVLMALGSSKGPQASFIADHPFLFFIRHNATRAVLFAGRFCSEK
uniref:Serpin B6 n=1 Tax=Neogobius melanostomus TaxID=47308 RepID=A0A8C6SWD9_9GOBI